MGHPDFARPNGVWGASFVPTADDIYFWTSATGRALNGDGGGVYAPAKPIIVGGAGIQLPAGSSVIKGGVITRNAGMIQHGDGDYIQLSPGRTRRVVMDAFSIVEAFDSGNVSQQVQIVQVPGLGIMPLASPVFMPIPPRFLHNGATLSSFEIHAYVTAPPIAMPTVPLSALIDGSTGQTMPAPLLAPWAESTPYAVGKFVTGDIPGNANGWYFECTTGGTSSNTTEPAWPAGPLGATVNDNGIVWTCAGQSCSLPASSYASAAALYAGGAPQIIVGTPSTATVIDTTSANYFAEILGANGVADSGGFFCITAIALNYSFIADLRAE